MEAETTDGDRAGLVLAGQLLEAKWAGEGNLGDIRKLVARRKLRPDVVVARRLSPASRQLLSEVGIGWVDETGAAEIAAGTLVVSRSGRPEATSGLKGWTPAVLAVAEALLCEVRATVSATEEATGLSTGSCTAALRFLTWRRAWSANCRRPGSKPSPVPRTCGRSRVDGSTLRPFPTVSVRELADEVEGLRVAPRPRVYVDLQTEGVRGEEAAEHLREVTRA